MPRIFRNRTTPLYITILLALSITGGCSRSEPPHPSSRQEQFRICMGGILAPLPFIAESKGYFQREGISAELSLMGDGKAAMQAFLEGKCDACLSGEFPVARQSFERNDLAIIATLASSDNTVKVLARRDRGIAVPADLVGKKIGVSKGTISNFFLDQFLKKNGIPGDKLTIIDISHQEIADALMRGEIDAFAGSDFAYLKGRQLIGDKGVTFTETGLTNHAACLTVKKDWLSSHGEVAQRALKALLKAEKELALSPDEQISMLSKRLKLPENDLKEILSEQHNRVSVDQVLILTLEDEARWMLENGIVKGKHLPNYLQFIDPVVLRSVDPKAVNLR